MEVTMTDQSVIHWIHKILSGYCCKETSKSCRKDGTNINAVDGVAL